MAILEARVPCVGFCALEELVFVGDIALLTSFGGTALTLALVAVAGADPDPKDILLDFARRLFEGLCLLAPLPSLPSPTFLSPIAEPGLDCMGLSELKKLDLRLRYAGEGGIFAIESIVRSTSEGRDVGWRGVLGSDGEGLSAGIGSSSLL